MGNDGPNATSRAMPGDVAKEVAIGCITHFLLGTAAFAFLGGAAVYKGWVGRSLFVSAALLLFAAALIFPRKERPS